MYLCYPLFFIFYYFIHLLFIIIFFSNIIIIMSQHGESQQTPKNNKKCIKLNQNKTKSNFIDSYGLHRRLVQDCKPNKIF